MYYIRSYAILELSHFFIKNISYEGKNHFTISKYYTENHSVPNSAKLRYFHICILTRMAELSLSKLRVGLFNLPELQ